MQDATILELIRPGVQPGAGTWADLGAGEGAFTRALRGILQPEADLYAVDVDGAALRRLRERLGEPGGVGGIHLLEADFTGPLGLPPLDGVLAANALHFRVDADATLRRIRDLLVPAGRLLVVEYESARASRWVPHPLPFATLTTLLPAAGFRPPERLASVPSRFGGAMYSALAFAT